MVLFVGAGWYARSVKTPQATLAIRAIAPALLFVPMMAAYRGYFQGTQDMKPTALSQIIEQFFRVIMGLALAVVLVSRGLETAAAGASFGATVGSAFGLLGIIGIYVYNRRKIRMRIEEGKQGSTEKALEILGKIFIIALPITIGAAIMPIMNMIDVAIVKTRLMEIGYTETAAATLFGELSGFAAPLINLPQVLIQAIAISLVPAIASAFQRKDMEFLRYNTTMGLRTAMIIALPCAFGMMSLSEPIMLLLYPKEQASAVSAASCLFILAIGIIFLSGIQTLTGVLQGIGKQNLPVVNLLIGSTVKIGCTFFLTGIPKINVRGAAIGTVAAYAVAFLLNAIAVKRYTGARFDPVLTFVKPLISVLSMSVCAYGSHRLLLGMFGNTLATLAAVGVGGAVYCVMLFVTKSVTIEELSMMPKGEKLAKVARALRRKS